MPRTIGIGVIAMGWMGMSHSRAYRQLTNRYPDSGIEPRLVICADTVADRTDEAQRRFAFERTTDDWRAVLEDPDVEVVSITSPNHLHVEMCTAALEAGKHVFCEKPLGRGPDETAAIAEAARDTGLVTFTGFCYRWSPVVQHLRGLIADGRLGRLTHYRGRFFVGYGSNPDTVLSWRFQRELAGAGVLGDIMSHSLDMALMLAGPIEEVVAQRETFIPDRPRAAAGSGTHFSTLPDGPREPVTNEDYIGVLTRFANGARGTLEVCRIMSAADSEMAFELNGTEGAARWNFERMNELHLYLADEHGSRGGYTRLQTGPEFPGHSVFNPGPAVGIGYEDLLTIQAHEFLTAVAENQPTAPSFETILSVAEVQAAIARSWNSGTWEHVTAIGNQETE